MKRVDSKDSASDAKLLGLLEQPLVSTSLSSKRLEMACSGSCWFTVGLRSGKLPVWGPNIIGMLLSFLQLALIVKYPAKPSCVGAEDFIPLLTEHSLAEIVQERSVDLAEAIIATWRACGAQVLDLK